MTAGLFVVAVLLAAPPPATAVGAEIRACERPSDCAAGDLCVGWVCASGSDEARVERLYRVAVPPAFASGEDRGVSGVAQAVQQQIVADLAWSGFYELLPNDRLPVGWVHEGASPSETRPDLWQLAGVHAVVKIAALAVAPGRYRVRVRLVDVERFGVVDLPEGDATIDASGARALSARWVNALIGWDTGRAGSIATRLVGVTEIKKGVKEIATVTADGTGFTQITRNGSLNLAPAWGPGGLIGWMSYATGNADWWVDGKPFSTRPGLNAAGAWSPDGKQLALSLAELGDSEIVLLDGATGDEEARLTDHRAVDTSPSWSPDGKRIAFVSDRAGGQPQIFLLSLRDGSLEQLTHDGYNTSPEWSPTGETIVYIRQAGSAFVIMRHDLDTHVTRRLTDGRRSAESPTFSPDGRYLAYELKDDEGSRLWLMNADGTNQRPAGDTHSFLSPSWQR
ncbi:MAG: PD40 domain-containing protein [Deltaproteobacteria bacterium]|nr:PD40 domain-containing protein [Deltaproteobacteria bacterium]